MPYSSNASVSTPGCGAGTQISGSSSWHLNFLASSPERFGPLNTKTIVLFKQFACPTNYDCWTGTHLKFVGSSSGHPKLLGLRLPLHSPGRRSRVTVFNHVRSRHSFAAARKLSVFANQDRWNEAHAHLMRLKCWNALRCWRHWPSIVLIFFGI